MTGEATSDRSLSILLQTGYEALLSLEAAPHVQCFRFRISDGSHLLRSRSAQCCSGYFHAAAFSGKYPVLLLSGHGLGFGAFSRSRVSSGLPLPYNMALAPRRSGSSSISRHFRGFRAATDTLGECENYAAYNGHILVPPAVTSSRN